jgi:AAA family ATP:ADP antiporter
VVGLLRTIRAGERRDVAAAFAALFGLVGSHAVLETARDALFLSSIPASHLPGVYVAIAALSLAGAELHGRVGRARSSRGLLGAWTAVAAVGTAGFWAFLPGFGPSGLYALYVWSGVIATMMLLQFWTLLGDAFSIGQAKRLYAAIGLGSVLGATAGSGVAGLLAGAVDARHLLLAAALGFALSALAARWLRDTASTDGGERDTLLVSARFVVRSPYARRLLGLAVVGAGATTLADYLFKSAAAASIAPAELARFFALVYVLLNGGALLVQIALVRPALRRLTALGALAVLPLLLALGGVALAAAGGLAAAFAVKGADGALRHTLHRTASELLYAPLATRARARAKAFADAVGQRGGQCLASLGILAAVWLGAPLPALGVGLAALAALWLVGLVELRGHYVDLFRRLLREDRIEHLEGFPQLDIASLETLIAALDSRDEAEVIAAMSVLERERRPHLIPALILYHPSERVVEHALALFVRTARSSAVHALDHLVDHPSIRIRQAMVAARSVLVEDERWLRMRLSEEESPEVRAAIMVNLIAAGAIVGSDARDALDSLLRHGTAGTRIALAEAIARRDAHGFEPALLELSRATEPAVRSAAAQAIGTVRSPSLVAALIDLTSAESTRKAAAAALIAFGDAGLAALVAALADPATPADVRWQLPWIATRFAPQPAATALVSQLTREWDGMVRYRLIVALERIARRQPDIQLDAAALDTVIDGTIRRAYRYLDRRLTLARGAERDPRRATPGHEILCRLLADKQADTVGRLYRLLGLAHRTEDLARIHRGLRSARSDVRDSGIELTEALLRPPLRGAVLGLVEDTPDAERLAAAGPYHAPLGLDYEGVLENMLASSSDSVRLLTVYHIGELGLRSLRAPVEAMARGEDPPGDAVRALHLLAEVAHAG